MTSFSLYTLHVLTLSVLLAASDGASALPMTTLPGRAMSSALPMMMPLPPANTPGPMAPLPNTLPQVAPAPGPALDPGGQPALLAAPANSGLDIIAPLDRPAPLVTSAPAIALQLEQELALTAQPGAARLATMAALLRRYPALIEADPSGAPSVRHEILAFSPSAAGLAAARAAGLHTLREAQFDGLGFSLLVLQVPDDSSTALVLSDLRRIDPAGVYDFNHLYARAASPGNARPSRVGGVAAAARQARSVGLIDSGIERTHPVFRDAKIHFWGCNNIPHGAPHGTAVAALMVGQSDRFQGVAPGATLYAADIYCDSPTGGSASDIVQALAWFATEQVAVINLSLVGPANLTLQRAVAAMVQRGYLLVAAVGNDGPAAAPLFPASYPGVVGVTAVDARRQPLPEAAQGPQVMFAAPGNNMASAAIGRPAYQAVRGTSFAAPIVAALLAGTLDKPDPAEAQRALAQLAQQAGHGARPNPATGFGIVGAAFRSDPARLQ